MDNMNLTSSSGNDKTITLLSLPLFAIIVVVSLKGILTPGFYARETPNWQIQSLAQDYTDLFLIAPVLLLSTILARRGHKYAGLILAGCLLYICYTFVLYCFDVKFNSMFPLYCICLGLSFYSLLYFFYKIVKSSLEIAPLNHALRKISAVYFILIATMFYLLWMAEILPSIAEDSVPKSIQDAGLFTNGVHVLDLSIVLPLIFINGILLFRKHPWSSILTPVLLSFFTLMDFSIGFIVVMMVRNGLGDSLAIAYVMGILAVISLILLILHLKSVKTENTGVI